jgi:hypothetical protein
LEDEDEEEEDGYKGHTLDSIRSSPQPVSPLVYRRRAPLLHQLLQMRRENNQVRYTSGNSSKLETGVQLLKPWAAIREKCMEGDNTGFPQKTGDFTQDFLFGMNAPNRGFEIRDYSENLKSRTHHGYSVSLLYLGFQIFAHSKVSI